MSPETMQYNQKSVKNNINKYDFLQGTEEKIELSNNARGHPIACILPPRLINKWFAIWGHPRFETIPHLPEMICVCVTENHPTQMHTHTHTHTHNSSCRGGWHKQKKKYNRTPFARTLGP